MEQLRKREKEGEGFSLSKSWLKKCVIEHQERKSHYREYKETLESPVPSDSWIWFPQTCSYIPTSVWKTDSWFFRVFFFPVWRCSGVSCVCCTAHSGSECSTVTSGCSNRESVEKIAEGLLPQGGFGWQFEGSQLW